MKVLKTKSLKISNLSYLHSKIIEEIYLSVAEGRHISKQEIASKIFYKVDSKIFENAINKILEKGFVEGNFDNGFKIPENCKFLLDIIETKNLKNITYYKDLSSSDISTQENLFDTYDFDKLVHNVTSWYSYVEEFSSDLILEKILNEKLGQSSIVYDPFIGSGTTSIAANLCGFDSIGFDSNPLMTLVSKVKTNWKLNVDKISKHFIKINADFLKNIKLDKDYNFNLSFSKMPPKELDQWLSLKNKKEISVLKNIINKIEDQDIKDFFKICMAKSAFDTSYVALCPGTTFYPFRKKEEFWINFGKKVLSKIEQLKLIQDKIKVGNSKFYNQSCLNVKNILKKDTIDFAITSPPYPNDLEYTRQTRLELYLLDLVNSMEQVAEIKKNMVKSSTKLIFKESSSSKFVSNNKEINSISEQIGKKLENKNWGWDYPRMVKEYFGDMYLCLKETKEVLKPNAKFMLLCGDQTIQGVYIPVCDILIKMAKSIGYTKATKESYRIRRSSGHKIPLPEDLVILQK